MTNMPPIFVGDAPGIDFLNSIATPAEKPTEWIGSGEDFIAWLEASRSVPLNVLDDFRRCAGPGELDAVAAQARGLREWFRQWVNEHKGKVLPENAAVQLEPLNRLLARDESFGQLAAGEDGAVIWQWQRRWRSPEALLIPLAESMAKLVTDENFQYVKACEGHGCTLMFVDRTRGHARRWCSMAMCGNRAKQAAHRQRKH